MDENYQRLRFWREELHQSHQPAREQSLHGISEDATKSKGAMSGSQGSSFHVTHFDSTVHGSTRRCI